MRDDVHRYLASVEQLAEVRQLVAAEGPERGARAIWARAAGGLEAWVHPDRGMDIGTVLYRGVPLSWRSPQPRAAPWHANQRDDDGWLDTFAGGLLVGCGLVQVGQPSTWGGRRLGLHGRLTFLAADRVTTTLEPEHAPKAVVIRGRVTEPFGLGGRLDLWREIRLQVDAPVLEVRDEVVNTGSDPSPLLLVYHLNFGHPLIDPADTSLEWPDRPSRILWGPDDDRDLGVILPPANDRAETVASYDIAGSDGSARVRVHNRRLLGGLSVEVEFDPLALPRLFHWRLFRTGVYAIGIEPATAGLGGRAREEEAGALAVLAPGERWHGGFVVTVRPNRGVVAWG